MNLNHHGNNCIRQELVEIAGRIYPVVQMGSQIWMAENLDLQFSGLTVGRQGDVSSSQDMLAWYWNDDESTYGWNGTRTGLLYNWLAVSYMHTNRASLFPGWKIPSWSDVSTFTSAYTDPSKLRRTCIGTDASVWTGTNDYKFNACPSGQRGGFKFYCGSYERNALVPSVYQYGVYYGYDEDDLFEYKLWNDDECI